MFSVFFIHTRLPYSYGRIHRIAEPSLHTYTRFTRALMPQRTL